jgi:hypothetical protein
MCNGDAWRLPLSSEDAIDFTDLYRVGASGDDGGMLEREQRRRARAVRGREGKGREGRGG